jgi:ferritin-like metal-binding protein YciE
MSQKNSPSISTLHQLLDYDVAHFHSAEVHLERSLNEWIKTTGSQQLRKVIQRYVEFVREHVRMMDKFITEEHINSIAVSNRVMQAFIDDANEKLSNCCDMPIRDACLLASIQSINHYKISEYGTAAAFAKTLDMEKQANAFHAAEVNEKQIDDRLNQLAEFEINAKAVV